MRAVVLRSDATEASGIGHFVRCVALAIASRAAGLDACISGEVTAPLALRMAAEAGIELVAAAVDADALTALAVHRGATVVHVDAYDGFDDLHAAGQRRQVITSTATDDEFGRRAADVIVNGSPRALTRFDPLYATADLCLGPAHLALRPLERRVRRSSASPLSVLVLMGGTDATGVGPELAARLRALSGVRRVGLVGTGASGDVESVERHPDLTRLIDGWDVVVTAAGTTIWELAALGVPMALVGVAENQRDHYDTLLANGMAAGLGFLPDGDEVDVAVFERGMEGASWTAMSEAASSVVDAGGAARIVEVWRAAWRDRTDDAGGLMTVRQAQIRDAGRLFSWRGDAVTRAASRVPSAPDWAGHVEWLARTLHDRRRLLLVGIHAGRAIGTTRFDALSPHEWEISITVAPEARGRGLAAPLVSDSIRRLAEQHPDALRIRAVLRRDNSASRALFIGLGFALQGAEEEWESWILALDGVRSGPS